LAVCDPISAAAVDAEGEAGWKPGAGGRTRDAPN